MRATQQRYPRWIRSSLLRRAHSPMRSASLHACAMSWTRQQSNSLGRHTDVGARSRCGSPSLGGRINSPRRFVDGCVAHRKLAQRRTCLSRNGSTPSFETRVSYSALLMVRLLVRIWGWVPGSEAWQGSLLREMRLGCLWKNCRSRRRDGCNWSGCWAALTWTMTAVSSHRTPTNLTHHPLLSSQPQSRLRPDRKW
jgi:hypothetical protein